jgi:pSer/pThr/pTyr-binding forkhead associated (FHA) protein
MLFILQVLNGPEQGTKLSLQLGQPLRIGRTTKAEHAFPDDPRMSGVHCAFECDTRGCRVRDLDSSNGTFLNGARIKESTLANGDEIRAGNTVIVFRIVAQESRAPLPSQPKPPSPPPAPPAAPAAPHLLFTDATPAAAPSSAMWPAAKPISPAVPQLRLPDLLRKDFQPLYALLDASREPSILKVILESKEEHQSLYEGAQGAQLTHFAPYLIRIPPKSALLDTLVNQAWSKSWGVFLTSDKPLKDLRTHFRHFLTVKLPDGQHVYFRYYDPRVLRLFLPTCLPEETTQFFGPVKQFLIEAEDPALALHFLPGPKGPQKKELHLAPT